MRILLADDDSKIHLVVQMWLRRRGYETVSVSNGREALAQIDQQRFDVLISDINMPLMNGLDLARAVVSHPHAPGLIIMLTSRCDGTDLARQFDSPRLHWLNKPFSPQELTNLIEKLTTPQVQPS